MGVAGLGGNGVGLAGHGVCGLPPKPGQYNYMIKMITRFQSEDQVCISTTLRELDKSVLTQTCRCESQSRLSN
jgi:hypothetical protein